jgi:cyclic pyranopterin phosphate synthase
MKDNFDRRIDYLRLSVTDRCNLRCFYCSPGRDFVFIPPQEILSYEEFLRLARLALEIGITRFRITGGEPLVRKGLTGFIHSLVELKGTKDIALTTNGVLLRENLNSLWEAGLRRLNISLDSLDPRAYREITGGGSLRSVLNAIDGALEKGFSPVKINAVLLKGKNDDLSAFVTLAAEKPVHVRFIELMDFSPSQGYFVSGREALARLARFGRLEEAAAPEGSGPARYFALPGMKGSIGFISPYSDHFCASCNRLRISADGRLLPCLFSGWSMNLKKMLRSGADDDSLKAALRHALSRKPRRREEAAAGERGNGLRRIGG